MTRDENTLTPTRRGVAKSIGVAAGAGTFGLAGCLGQGGGGGAQGTGTEPETRRLIYGGGSQGSAAYQMGTGLAQLVKEKTDGAIKISVQTSGGDEIEFRGVEKGTFDLATGTTPDFYKADKANAPFKHEIDVNLGFTWATYPFPLAFTLDSNEDINYIEDLEGKKVVSGPPGSVLHFYFVKYMEANDLDVDSVEFQRINSKEGFRLLNDGRVDAVGAAALNDNPGPSASQWMNRTDNPKLVVPKTSQRSIHLGEYVGGGVVWNLALEDFGDAWKNSAVSDQSHIKLIAGTATLFTHLRIPDEPIYQITKVAIENRERLVDYHALWGGFAKKPEKFATAIPMKDAKASPFHPGAVKALKETGFWDDKLPVAERSGE